MNSIAMYNICTRQEERNKRSPNSTASMSVNPCSIPKGSDSTQPSSKTSAANGDGASRKIDSDSEDDDDEDN